MLTEIVPVPGYRWFGTNIGIKDDSLDFGGLLSTVPANAAAVFTRSTMPGAPVLVGREHVRDGRLQAVIVNSKNANVATEHRGIEDSRMICRLVAAGCGIDTQLVLPSSTGVIGRYLPMDQITRACARVNEWLSEEVTAMEAFARAIMTTDTRPKWYSAAAGKARIFAVAKGSGMIAPNMATMLSYMVTDAQIDPIDLHSMLTRVVNKSFNRVSVDGDTSTSDTVVLMANGLAGRVDPADFESVLERCATALAKAIAADGEGASKLIELKVSGAATADQALRTAQSVINSPLVKTAIYGADPNWGRFIMAIGKVFDYQVPIEGLKIWFGHGDGRHGDGRHGIDIRAIDNDEVPLEAIKEQLRGSEIYLEIDLGCGAFSETVWGCDLTEGYIRENAYYTT